MTQFNPRARFSNWLIARAVASGKPDFVIGGELNPYMYRWWLTPWSHFYRVRSELKWWQWLVTRLPGVYLHLILRSDDDRALHDHPWFNVSVLLRGAYLEHTIAAGGVHVRRRRVAGSIVFRRARCAHRLEIDDGPCWSLFFCGVRTREWGFHCPERGWVNWRDFTNPADNGATIGKGCDP